MKPTLVVLAAGMGSRYGGLKQVDPVGPSGEAILDYSVFDAVRGGFRSSSLGDNLPRSVSRLRRASRPSLRLRLRGWGRRSSKNHSDYCAEIGCDATRRAHPLYQNRERFWYNTRKF